LSLSGGSLPSDALHCATNPKPSSLTLQSATRGRGTSRISFWCACKVFLSGVPVPGSHQGRVRLSAPGQVYADMRRQPRVPVPVHTRARGRRCTASRTVGVFNHKLHLSVVYTGARACAQRARTAAATPHRAMQTAPRATDNHSVPNIKFLSLTPTAYVEAGANASASTAWPSRAYSRPAAAASCERNGRGRCLRRCRAWWSLGAWASIAVRAATPSPAVRRRRAWGTMGNGFGTVSLPSMLSPPPACGLKKPGASHSSACPRCRYEFSRAMGSPYCRHRTLSGRRPPSRRTFALHTCVGGVGRAFARRATHATHAAP
jgi:hypothetical protein